MVSLAKGNLALYRCNREEGNLEVASALKVSGDGIQIAIAASTLP